MEVIKTEIDGVLILQPKVFFDDRGFFFESWNQSVFDAAIGRHINFVQDNESCSEYGVIRGLHFQRGEYWQAKLVRTVVGKVLDVAVDLRKESSSYGKYVSVELSAENHRQLFIPHGFAHGFAVLSPKAVFQYKCDRPYAPHQEGAVLWNDPELSIDWKIPIEKIILSEKDKHNSTLSNLKI